MGALEILLVLAGAGQIALFAASFAIPRVMRWSEDLARVRPIFLLHGGLVLLERRGRPIGGALGRVWCIVWLVAPLPILFHPPFWRGVLWPIIGAA